jgi:hypothetical protein
MLRLFRDQRAMSAKAALSRPDPLHFPSQCLGEFLNRLQRADEHPSVLDLGVLCGDNIAFLGERGCKVSVESLPEIQPPEPEDPSDPDLDLNSGDAAETGEMAGPVVPPLDYPPRSYGGVLAWDAIARLPYQVGIGFVETLRRILLDEGVILAYFPGPPGSPQGSAGRYRIVEEGRLIVERAHEVPLPGHVYTNREIYGIFSRFDVVRLSHLKTGTREVLVAKSTRGRKHLRRPA